MVFQYPRCLAVAITLFTFYSRSVTALPGSTVQVVSNPDCDCGFQDVQDPTGQTWTTYWESDFTQTSLEDIMKIYAFMSYTVQHTGAAVRIFDPANVAVDSSGIHLTVQPQNATGIPCAGIFSKTKDFGFGSYHYEAQFPAIGGTVKAFYVYKNDTNEVDIESVTTSGASPVVDYSVKPQIFLPNGGASGETFLQDTPDFDLSAAFHNYSFVWNSTSVIFAVDDKWSTPIVTNVPTDPGTLAISHWSDGNPVYSGGPPTSPDVLTLSRVWAYYNATGATLTCQKSSSPCSGSKVTAPGSSTGSSTTTSSKSPTGTSKPSASSRLTLSVAGLVGAFVVSACALISSF